MPWVGPSIAAASDLAGMAFQHFTRPDNSFQENQAAENMRLQKNFATKGIRWRVEDAKAAGVHPLFALGAQLPSYQPTSYHEGGGGSSIAEGFSNFGQNIGRAIDATRTKPERMTTHQNRLIDLDLENRQLQNELIRAQIAHMGVASNPPMPSNLPSAMPGQGDFTAGGSAGTPYEVKAPEIMATQPGYQFQEGGAHPSSRWERTPTGWKPQASAQVYQEQDISSPAYLEWWIRNRIAPTFDSGMRKQNAPPKEWLPKGASRWLFDPFSGEYRPFYQSRR